MAIFTAIVAAIGALGTFFGTAIGSFILKTVVGLGVSLLQKAIAGKPEGPRFSVQGKLQAGGDLPRSFIVGLGATAGSLAYGNTWGNDGKTPNAYLTQVIALSDLPITGLAQVWVNGELCTLGDTPRMHNGHVVGYPVLEYRKGDTDYLWVNFYDGTQTVADPFLVDVFGNDSERPYKSTRVGVGVAYIVATAKLSENLFTGFPQYRWAANGVKFYDPSRDTTVGGSGPQREDDPSTWGGDGDHLPAVQIFNLLRGITFGGKWFYGLQNMAAARLPKAAAIAEINKCRALIAGPGGMEATYRTGGEIQVSAPIADAIEAMLTGAQGRLAEIGGFYKMHVGAPDVASAAFDDGHILSTEEQSFTPFFGLADTVNGIAATYPNPDEGWAVKVAPPLYRVDLEVLAGNRRLMASVPLDLVPYKGQVQRLMKSALEEAQRARRHTLVLPPQFWTVEPGDYVQWTSERNGYVAKLFRVDGVVDKANLDVMIDITEVDPSDYDWDQGADYKEPIDGPVGPIRPAPQQMTGWQVQKANFYDASGKARRPSIEVFFDGDEIDVRSVRVQVRLAADQSGVFDAELPYGDPEANPNPNSVILDGTFLPNTLYEVRGKFVANSDRETEWSLWLSVTTDNIRLGPDDVDYGEIDEAIADYTNWVGWNTRETIERARKNINLDIDQDAANYRDKQELRRELTSSYQLSEANYTEAILVATGPDSALSQQIVQLDAKLDTGLASITTLLQTEVTRIDGITTANSNAIQSVEAEVGDVAASVTVRSQASAAPSGWTARYGVEARGGVGDDWSVAAFFLDAKAGLSRFVGIADQFVFADPSDLNNLVNPIVFQSGVAHLNGIKADWADIVNVDIGWADIETAVVNNLIVSNAMIADLSVDTIKLAGDAINVTNSAFSAGNIFVSFSQTDVQSVTLNVPADALFVRCIFTAQTSNLNHIPVFNFYVDGVFTLTTEVRRSPFQVEFVWMTPTAGNHTFLVRMYAQGAGAGQGWDVSQRRLHASAQRR